MIDEEFARLKYRATPRAAHRGGDCASIMLGFKEYFRDVLGILVRILNVDSAGQRAQGVSNVM
jgi:hypothetical protein